MGYRKKKYERFPRLPTVAASPARHFVLAADNFAECLIFEILWRYQPERYTTWDEWKRRQTTGKSFWQCLRDFQNSILKERTPQHPDPEDYETMADFNE